MGAIKPHCPCNDKAELGAVYRIAFCALFDTTAIAKALGLRCLLQAPRLSGQMWMANPTPRKQSFTQGGLQPED
ncbi:MAG: hypothetical protein A3F73_11400 [Gallionellales bacterium RIFCSPLOWO2_12_FULL_59_22]|nr:MAG: hypothetical protein A3H99_11095 [Gallionellales bacterium RIFCSPLOWO2_02_FULL_59_110]OGT04512.1 MAG: hypothetical protein A2Z65_03000 [Gallionellales bacterium RIFCSPLOWO2_02_58_13]OGT13517.1 MAG: hypothetical protein A3F73_11400 [Gallionellales bacterium RIFCSPLOWO2_12_FULL_59_22]